MVVQGIVLEDTYRGHLKTRETGGCESPGEDEHCKRG